MPPTDADPPTDSVWLETSEQTSFGPLEEDRRVDAVVVGGGIVGVTTAYELASAGREVALVERDRVLAGVTGHTTAKLTSLHGLIYDRLLDRFGERAAHQYARANQAAIEYVETTASDLDVDCQFERTPAYTFTADPDKAGNVRDEADAAARLGLPATAVESTPLPFDDAGAVRLDDQAIFHPRRFLLPLAERVVEAGGNVFERTTAVDLEDGDPCRVTTDRGRVVADDVVVATLFPFYDRALYFTRLYPKRSYVLGVRLAEESPDGTYYQPEDPYVSVRPNPAGEGSMILFGGQNHRTGHGGNTAERYRRLESQARERFDVESVEYRWSTQDYVSIDRVPFVGRHSWWAENVHVATGFGGWGMTNGIAAGRILADRILGRESPWADVFRPTRLDPRGLSRHALTHNADATRHFLEDVFGQPPTREVVRLRPDEATVVETADGPIGVSLDEDGEVVAVSAVCTHLDCHVGWNDAEASWDCPCHGSRFDQDGDVLATPAVENLEAYTEADLRDLGVRVERC